jgi:hypothetical protein
MTSFGRASQPRAVSTRIGVDLFDFLFLPLAVVFTGVVIIGIADIGAPEIGIPVSGVVIAGMSKLGVVIIGVPGIGIAISFVNDLSST